MEEAVARVKDLSSPSLARGKRRRTQVEEAVARVKDLNRQCDEKIRSLVVLLERREQEDTNEGLLIQIGDHGADLAAIVVKGAIALDLVRKRVDEELEAMGNTPDFPQMLRLVQDNEALEVCDKLQQNSKKIGLLIIMIKSISEEYRKPK